MPYYIKKIYYYHPSSSPPPSGRVALVKTRDSGTKRRKLRCKLKPSLEGREQCCTVSDEGQSAHHNTAGHNRLALAV
ncbi:hypothetical protein O3P69_016835 [Scylla paramamosain]|uniref:Uncharacterized protein n=1 Tax=Scylla paramamosain TaxID=85552 RepID=A0AAW0SZT3_SCYPA